MTSKNVLYIHIYIQYEKRNKIIQVLHLFLYIHASYSNKTDMNIFSIEGSLLCRQFSFLNKMQQTIGT